MNDRRLAAWVDGVCKTCGAYTHSCKCEQPDSSAFEELFAAAAATRQHEGLLRGVESLLRRSLRYGLLRGESEAMLIEIDHALTATSLAGSLRGAEPSQSAVGAPTPRTKAQCLSAVIEELSLDTTDPFTRLLAAAFALQDAYDESRAALSATRGSILEDVARKIEQRRDERWHQEGGTHAPDTNEPVGASHISDWIEAMDDAVELVRAMKSAAAQ